jgi:uncharacterized lipoprotein YddW (UPF0748 family)
MNEKTKEMLTWLLIAVVVVFIVSCLEFLLKKPEETKIPSPLEEISTSSREARAVWMSRFEYTQNLGTTEPKKIKKYIKEVFTNAKAANLNIVFFQIRGNGDAFYKSKYEPWSNLLTGNLGEDPGWDPLDYANELAHQLGLELHAWINTFPAWRGLEDPIKTDLPHPYLAHPEWLICDSAGVPMPKTQHYVSFSPGIPAVHEHIINVVLDIVNNYDIDGIHFDYIRYPEGASVKGYSHDPISVERFNSKEGNPLDLSWDDWQREQVTTFISKAYNAIISIKPLLKVSAAVIGNYNDTNWNGYHVVYQDPRRWSELKKIDMIVPMIYYGRNENGLQFPVTIKNWKDNYILNDRLLLAGIGVYRLDWEEFLLEIDDARAINLDGFAFFSASSFDEEKWMDLESRKFQYPAAIPAFPWKDAVPPLPPEKFIVLRSRSEVSISWDTPPPAKDGDMPSKFIIYRSKTVPISTNNSRNIFAIVQGKNSQFIYKEKSENDNTTYYYAVSSIDACGNESELIYESDTFDCLPADE